VHLLAWKDGKVRRDTKGLYETRRPNISYRVEQTKPNTLGLRHEKILKSKEFFSWASKVRKTRHFDTGLIDELQEEFTLWKTIVMPVFLLHCLRPPIFPIVDRYVIVVYNIFQQAQAERANPKRITAKAYGKYHSWWLRVVNEAGIRPLSAEINQLKDMDSGIWALGKSISSRAKELIESMDEDLKESSNVVRGAGDGQPLLEVEYTLGTESKEFKTRAIELWRQGKTQANAIQRAAQEMGISLKRSYVAYPGSHFDRWRKQGYWKKAA
jgi:hypothetical protein